MQYKIYYYPLASLFYAPLWWCGFLLFNLTIQNIILRFFFMALFSAVFMYLASASSLGDIGNLVALVIAFLMTLIEDIP